LAKILEVWKAEKQLYQFPEKSKLTGKSTKIVIKYHSKPRIDRTIHQKLKKIINFSKQKLNTSAKT